MSLFIPGVNKPEKCCYCPLVRYYHENGRVWCNVLNEIIAEIPYEDRLLDSALENIEIPEFCPLVEIKAPHGRLIDADAYDYPGDLVHESTYKKGRRQNMGAAKIIKKALVDKEMTQGELAEKLGRHPQTVHNAMSRDKMNFAMVQKIAALLDCEIIFRHKKSKRKKAINISGLPSSYVDDSSRLSIPSN